MASSVATLSDANYVNFEDGVLKPFHAVIAVKDIELDPVTDGAPLFCVNPPEELHVVYKAIDDALPTMTPDDETKWRKRFQSCTMTCTVLGTEKKGDGDLEDARRGGCSGRCVTLLYSAMDPENLEHEVVTGEKWSQSKQC